MFQRYRLSKSIFASFRLYIIISCKFAWCLDFTCMYVLVDLFLNLCSLQVSDFLQYRYDYKMRK